MVKYIFGKVMGKLSGGILGLIIGLVAGFIGTVCLLAFGMVKGDMEIAPRAKKEETPKKATRTKKTTTS